MSQTRAREGGTPCLHKRPTLPLPDLSEGPCFILRGARQASAVVVVWNKVSARHDGGLKGPVESVGSHSWTRRWGLCTPGAQCTSPLGCWARACGAILPRPWRVRRPPFPASTPLHTAPACIRGVCVPEWRPASHGWEGRSPAGAASSRVAAAGECRSRPALAAPPRRPVSEGRSLGFGIEERRLKDLNTFPHPWSLQGCSAGHGLPVHWPALPLQRPPLPHKKAYHCVA